MLIAVYKPICKLILFIACVIAGLVMQFSVIAQNNDLLVANTMDWSHDGNRIAIGYQSGAVDIKDATTTNSIRIINLPNQAVVSVAWNPVDSDEIAVSSVSPSFGFVKIFDVSTGNVLTDIKIDNGAVGVGSLMVAD